MFQRRLKDETRQISVTEESICSELEAFESKSLQQVRHLMSNSDFRFHRWTCSITLQQCGGDVYLLLSVR